MTANLTIEAGLGELIQVIVLTTIAGAAIPAGALLGRIERIQPYWIEREFRHGVIAFGGGVLLAAVALVLVPQGIDRLAMPWVVSAFTTGGVVFLLIDRGLARLGGSASNLIAMLADFVPEAIALGAACAAGKPMVYLLAMLITLQNLPEGFNAYREISASGGLRGRRMVLVFVALVPLGPAAGLAGLYWLASMPAVVGGVMLFAAGGILYLTFQDIAPQARIARAWGPPLGAVLGFLLGIVGHILVH